jgi:hypothetical protein
MGRAALLVPVVRAGLLLAGCLAGAAGSWLLARDPLLVVSGARDGVSVEQAVSGLCAAALPGCAVWLLVTTTLATACCVAELVPGRCSTALQDVSARCCPRTARRLVATMLGVAVSAGVAGPALADRTGPEALVGLRVPDRTTGAVVAVRARGSARAVATVTVAGGDSLWSIAERLLPHGATDRQVTAGWHRLHRRNLARIGPDADLIHPGTRLVVPDLAAADQ